MAKWHWQCGGMPIGRQKYLFPVFILIVPLIFILTTAVVFRTGFQFDHDIPADVDKENLQYAVVIDAGSSGSRVYIYFWPPHTGNPRELLNMSPLQNKLGEPVVRKLDPGLSSVANDPSQASDYIAPLVQFAADNIPVSRHKETPLYILATAGLRLLNSSQQVAILDDLRTDIPKQFLFNFAPTNAEVLTGKQEGVYQWIAINYVLQRFNHKSDAPLVAVDTRGSSSESPMLFRKQTVGILDMGGASMQTAVEVISRVQLESLQAEEKINNLAEFNLGCLEHGEDHVYRVYVTTYLGLGANEVLKLYESQLIENATKNYSYGSAGSSVRLPIRDPCKPMDYTHTVNATLPVGHATTNGSFASPTTVTLYFRGTGLFDECRVSLRPVLRNLTGCPGWNCILTKQPVDLAIADLYGFSEFWYSMEDVLRIGGPYNFSKFQQAAKEFCATRWPTLLSRYKNKLYPLADKKRFLYQCIKSAWIAAVLHDGMALSEDHPHLRSSPNTVRDEVVHWTLGAALYRTRFFPLGAVQRENMQQSNKPTYFSLILYLNHYLFIICFFFVFSAILLYLRGLRCLRPGLRRVSSRSFVAHENDLEKGSLVVDGFYR